MDFTSTRQSPMTTGVDFVTAIQQGLANDGGLFVPSYWPIPDLEILKKLSLIPFAQQVLAPFVANTVLQQQLSYCCQKTYAFPLPLKHLGDGLSVLELFHGPTLSFKDFGATFLACCLSFINQPLTILVATSGDTGSAVASGFFNQPNIRVLILFPKDKISARQQAQMTCWGKNIAVLAVEGDFDSCQHLVKQAFGHPDLSGQLSTANSINIGRLVAQIVYFAYTATRWWVRRGEPMSMVIPSGNVGNVTACFYAKQLGFPIGAVHIATNANRTLSEYWQKGELCCAETIPTLANAMDVSVPSNLERLRRLFQSHAVFQKAMTVTMVSDAQIRHAITDGYQRYGYVMCPHTATAYHVAQRLPGASCIAATADPAKFESVVEPLLGIKVPIPDRLAAMIEDARSPATIGPTLEALLPVLNTVLAHNG